MDKIGMHEGRIFFSKKIKLEQTFFFQIKCILYTSFCHVTLNRFFLSQPNITLHTVLINYKILKESKSQYINLSVVGKNSQEG